jgi:hypothetical protein
MAVNLPQNHAQGRHKIMTQHESPTTVQELGIVASSGLLDPEWYLSSYPNVRAQEVDPVAHFCREGWRLGCRPNPYFHPDWYARTYGSELFAEENPLLHYIRRGERENAWPSPHFDPEWYRDEYALGERESPLRHYLLNRTSVAFSPVPLFDAVAYTAAHPELLAAGQDPYLHWLQEQEGVEQNPAQEITFATVLGLAGAGSGGTVPDTVSWETLTEILRLFIPLIPFDETWYCASNLDVAEALRTGQIASAQGHFIEQGFFEGRSPVPSR